MLNKKPLLIASSALAAMAFAPASAATIFSSTIEEAQSTTPTGDMDAMTSNTLFGQASLALSPSSGSNYALSMSLDFTDGFDWSAVASSGQVNVRGMENMTPAPDSAPDVTRFHLHNADRGTAGDVVFGLFDLVMPAAVSDMDGETTLTFNNDDSVTITTEWDSNEGFGGATLNDFAADMLAAADGDDIALYYNLHTENSPGGLIRGQVVAENAVPIPAAPALFMTGLAAVGLARRKKNGAKA